MIRRRLGGTDLSISAVGLGLFAAGGFMWGAQDDADTLAAIHAAVDAGIDWVDTAPLYGAGRADRVLGRALRELPPSRRPRVFGKFGHHVIDGKRVCDGSAMRVRSDCDEALRAFGVERIDVFQLHWPAPQPMAETAAACAELLKAGKIGAVGVSNFSVDQLEAWLATGVPLASVQNPYSLVKPEAEADVLPWCAERQVGFLAYSPLHRGLLFGAWGRDKTFPAGDHRGERADWTGPRLQRWLDAVEELRAIGADDDLSVPQLAIGALLAHEGLTACIVGARNAAQGSALGSLACPLRARQLDAVEAVMKNARTAVAALPPA